MKNGARKGPKKTGASERTTPARSYSGAVGKLKPKVVFRSQRLRDFVHFVG